MTIINSITGGSSDKEPKRQQKTVTPGNANQTVTADSGFDGLQFVSIAGSDNLVASNVKYGKNIFGVVGTFEHTSTSSYYIKNATTIIPYSSKTNAGLKGFDIFVGQNNAPDLKVYKETGDISGRASWSYTKDSGYFTTKVVEGSADGFDAVISARSCRMTCTTNLPNGTYTVGLSTFCPVRASSPMLKSNVDMLYAIKPTLSRYSMSVSNGLGTINNVQFTIESGRWGMSDFGIRSPTGALFSDGSGGSGFMFAAQVNYFSK